MSDPLDDKSGIDPDPFAIGLGLFQVIAGGVMFLEARLQRQVLQQTQREQFRAAYFQAKRNLIFFKRSTDEFETYVLEGGYGRRQFRIGSWRVTLDQYQHQAMRRLHGQIMTTANHMADSLDDLSNYLGPQDQGNVDKILERANAIQSLPESYRDVISLAREAMQLFQDMLDDIGEREKFDEDQT